MEKSVLENGGLESREENILGTAKISKLFIKFSLPAIIAMLISGMQSVVDGIFVGNFIGANAMASISMASPFLQIMMGFSLLMSVGCVSYMGRSLGEGNKKLTQDIFRTSTIILVAISIILTIVGFFFSKNIAGFLGANDVLLDDVATYIKIISIFAVPLGLAFLLGFVNRLVERPDLYFKGMIVSLITNIVLNYILIGKLGFGIAGAAFATGISYSMVLIIVISPMINKKNVFNLFTGNFDIKTIVPVMYNGSSEAVASIAAAISAFLFNMAFIKLVGEGGIAAFTSINYVAQFGILVAFGVVDGIASIISYNYGAKRFDRVHEILNLSIKVLLATCLITFIILFFFSENLISLFVSSEKEILDMAIKGSKIYAFAFLTNGLNILCSSYFTAIGYAKESIIVAICRGLIFIVLGISILPTILGLNGVWLTIPFAEVMTLGVCFIIVKKYLKKSGHYSS